MKKATKITNKTNGGQCPAAVACPSKVVSESRFEGMYLGRLCTSGSGV